MNNPYDTLGVDKDATQDQIKKAYRKKAMKSHPDHGGDQAEFTAIAIAYRIIGDPDERAHFDRTGKQREANQRFRQACDIIGKFFCDIMQNRIDTIASGRTDPIREVLAKLDTATGIERTKMAECELHIKKQKKVLKRIIRDGTKAGPSIIEGIMENMIHNFEDQIAYSKESLEVIAEARAILEPYTFKRETPPAGTPKSAQWVPAEFGSCIFDALKYQTEPI